MPSGIASIPRYQHGGPHPEPPSERIIRALTEMAAQGNVDAAEHLVEIELRDDPFKALERTAPPVTPAERSGIQTLFGGQFSDISPEPDPSSVHWFGGGGVPSLSAEEFAKLTPQQQVDYVLLREFDTLADLRKIIGGDASFAAEPSNALTPSRSQTLRKEWFDRNPDAPTRSSSGPLPQDQYTRAGVPKRPQGSYQSLFPAHEAPYDIEKVLFDIMGTEITPEEIVLAWEDPMFGKALPFDASDAEINERVYGRRYANKRFGRRAGPAPPISRWNIARQVVEGAYGPGVAAMPYTTQNEAAYQLGETIRNLSGEPLDVDPPLRRGRMGRFRQGIGSFRQGVGDYFSTRNLRPPSVPESPLTLPPPSYLDEGVDPPPRSPLARVVGRASTAAGGTRNAILRAIRDNLPAIIATTGAVGTGLGTAIDLAASPTKLGPGTTGEDEYSSTWPYTPIPEESPLTDEEKMMYYEELMGLGENLGVTPPFSTRPRVSPQGSSIRRRGFGRASGGIIPLRSHHRVA